MDAASLELLKELINALLSASGGLGLVGTGVLFSLRLLKHFAPSIWNKLPWYAKLALPFATAGAGTFLLTLPTGWLPALSAALTAGLGAVGLHHASKAAGSALAPKLPTKLSPLQVKGLRVMLDIPPNNVVELKKS